MSAGIDTALSVARRAHIGQVDKGGKPYICHPMYVASQQVTEDGMIVALLHDVVEDSSYKIDELRCIGFSEKVVEAVNLLTHKENEDYFDYIRAIKENELARNVKLADLRHNSDLSRLKEVTDKDVARVKKYQQAIEILQK